MPSLPWDECIQILISVYTCRTVLDKSLMLIIILLTKTARKIFSILKSLSGFDTSIGGFMLATVCFSGQLGSLGRIIARHAIAGSGVSNESRYVDN